MVRRIELESDRVADISCELCRLKLESSGASLDSVNLRRLA